MQLILDADATAPEDDYILYHESSAFKVVDGLPSKPWLLEDSLLLKVKRFAEPDELALLPTYASRAASRLEETHCENQNRLRQLMSVRPINHKKFMLAKAVALTPKQQDDSVRGIWSSSQPFPYKDPLRHGPDAQVLRDAGSNAFVCLNCLQPVPHQYLHGHGLFPVSRHMCDERGVPPLGGRVKTKHVNLFYKRSAYRPEDLWQLENERCGAVTSRMFCDIFKGLSPSCMTVDFEYGKWWVVAAMRFGSSFAGLSFFLKRCAKEDFRLLEIRTLVATVIVCKLQPQCCSSHCP